jgi:hypothetical protein
MPRHISWQRFLNFVFEVGSETTRYSLTGLTLSTGFGKRVFRVSVRHFHHLKKQGRTTSFGKSLRTINDLFCAPGAIRTHDPQFRKLMLYPAELRVHVKNEQLKKADRNYILVWDG